MKKLLLIILFMPILANAKAKFYSLEEMVNRADVIVIGEVINIENGEFKGEHWTYNQKVNVWVSEQIKGNTNQDIVIMGNENFICAQTIYDYGHYILFLKRQGSEYISANWQLGAVKIDSGKVNWYKDQTKLFDREEKALDLAVKQVKRLVSQAK